MRTSSPGFTLVELMIVIACVGILGIFAITSLGGCTTPDMIKTSGTANAHAYAVEMGWTVKGASCSAKDTDQDGDTTCNIRVAGATADAPDATHAIECNYERAFAPLGQATGCKPVVFAAGFGATQQAQ